MIAEELLRQARTQGASFELMKSGRIKILADSPLPETLMAELRQHKDDIRVLLVQVPDYQATACVCPVPKGPTGCFRCGVCGLALICPDCQLCRGCKLCLRFKRRQPVLPPAAGEWLADS